MEFSRMLLMCSALITCAYSFPTDPQKNNTTMSKNDTNLLNAKENERPLVFIMEDKDPKSDSVIVQFVYTSNGGNSLIQTLGKEKDKYAIQNPVQEENKSTNEKDEKKSDDRTAQKAAQSHNNEKKSDISTFQISPIKLFAPEEESSLLNKWSKFSDVFAPIKPFPELHTEKRNQINIDKVTKQNDETYISNNRKERKEVPYVAGPQLNPVSMYHRLFDVPIIDF